MSSVTTRLHISGSRLRASSTSTPSSRTGHHGHIRRCDSHCEANIAACPRMPLFTSAIPMPTSVTSMDHCDRSMHITDLNPIFVKTWAHRSHEKARATLLNETARRTPCGNGVTTGLSRGTTCPVAASSKAVNRCRPCHRSYQWHFQHQVPGVTALTVNTTLAEEFLAKVGASNELILGCVVTKLIEMTTWTTTSCPLTQRPFPRGPLQAADRHGCLPRAHDIRYA